MEADIEVPGDVDDTSNAAAHPKQAAQVSAASSSHGDAEKPAEVVETRSAGTGVTTADVDMPEEDVEFHSAAEDDDMPEAAEDDDMPEEDVEVKTEPVDAPTDV